MNRSIPEELSKVRIKTAGAIHDDFFLTHSISMCGTIDNGVSLDWSDGEGVNCVASFEDLERFVEDERARRNEEIIERMKNDQT